MAWERPQRKERNNLEYLFLELGKGDSLFHVLLETCRAPRFVNLDPMFLLALFWPMLLVICFPGCICPSSRRTHRRRRSRSRRFLPEPDGSMSQVGRLSV